MGKRTSVYLTTELQEAVAATGLRLAELIWRGVAAVDEQPAIDQAVEDVLLDKAEQRHGAHTRKPGCPHPKARRSKGGLCMACGENIG